MIQTNTSGLYKYFENVIPFGKRAYMFYGEEENGR